VHLLSDLTAVGPFSLDLTASMLFPFSRSLHPFWTSFPLRICSQDESYSLNGYSLRARSLLNLMEFSPEEEKNCESFKDLKEFHEFFVHYCNLCQI
jgi:hypothetical protein